MIHLPSFPAAPSPDPRPQGTRCERRVLGRLLVTTVAVALMACESTRPAESGEVSIVGYIDFNDIAGIEPQVPKTATAGSPLEITFWTHAGGCVQRIDRTDVTVDRGTAVVTPHDVLTLSPGCTDDIRFLKHRATVVFDEPGSRKIVLRYSTARDPSRDRIADGQAEYIVEVSPVG